MVGHPPWTHLTQLCLSLQKNVLSPKSCQSAWPDLHGEKTRIKRRLECFAKTDVQPLEILSSILKKNDLWIANLGHGFQLESNLKSTPIPKLCSDAEKMVENRLKVATIN